MDAKSAYLKGLYKEALIDNISIDTVCYKIGALVFVGEHQEARLLFQHHQAKMDQESQTIARFHMGLSYTRTSEYVKAQEFFLQNILSLRKGQLSDIGAFFACQGVSFYRYFFSQHRKSQRFAILGYSFLMKLTNPPSLLLALSLDIQGYNLVQMGKIHLGLKSLEKALQITKENELKQLHSEIEISYYLYKSEYDDNLNEQILNLNKILIHTDNKNDYSRSELVVQIAKLYFLMGDFSKAHGFLTEHFDLIYKNENKRKIAKVNTLIAQLMISRGQFIEALSIINVAERNLDEKIDLSLILPILGLKSKLLKILNRETTEIEEKIKSLLHRADRQINKKIQGRLDDKISPTEIGDDLVGDLIDSIYRKNIFALRKVLEKNMLFLVPIYYDLRPGDLKIVMNQSLEVVITIGHDKISLIKKNMTKTQIIILSKLTSSGISKEDLVQEVWGYEYESLRHDSLVYTAIARIRKNLGDKGHWILADEQKYYLAPKVQLHFEESIPTRSNSQELTSRKKEFLNLNYRQLQTLADAPDQALSVSQYGNQWSVTRTTALRDLKTMVEKGLAQKIGQGKATRYFILN